MKWALRNIANRKALEFYQQNQIMWYMCSVKCSPFGISRYFMRQLSQVTWIFSIDCTGIILCMHICQANERWRNNVTSLIGWAHTQNDPYCIKQLMSGTKEKSLANCKSCNWNVYSIHLTVQLWQKYELLVIFIQWLLNHKSYIDGIEQNGGNSIVNALELMQTCTTVSHWHVFKIYTGQREQQGWF